MGLSAALARLAARRAHVLVVEAPGALSVRAALEAELRRRGWVPAATPAEADVLAVVGRPDERWRELLGRVYEQMPGPRARVEVPSAEAVTAALDDAERALIDDQAQRQDAATRRRRPVVAGPEEHGADKGMDHEGADHEGMDHEDMDHEDMDHEDMDMDMAPAGIPLAEGADDRDGLEMDELHVPLGPALVNWPAGLVLRCTLHGDLVVHAEAEQLAAEAVVDADDAATRAAQHLEAAASVLELAGWTAEARRVRILRDGCWRTGGHSSADALVRRIESERQRVSRARVLRWSLARLGMLDHRLAESLPAGDVRDRLLTQFETAAAELCGERAVLPPVGELRDLLPELVRGRDLAEVRLLVAGLSAALSIPEAVTVRG